jgi:hypothetical protein
VRRPQDGQNVAFSGRGPPQCEHVSTATLLPPPANW